MYINIIKKEWRGSAGERVDVGGEVIWGGSDTATLVHRGRRLQQAMTDPRGVFNCIQIKSRKQQR